MRTNTIKHSCKDKLAAQVIFALTDALSIGDERVLQRRVRSDRAIIQPRRVAFVFPSSDLLSGLPLVYH